MVIECYAQRLLSPFRGTMLTIRYEAAEAVTLDAVRWDLYVANDRLRDGVEARGRIQVSDIRYGLHYMFSDDNVFEDNTFENGDAGTAIMYSERIVFRRNRFLRNRGFASVGLLFQGCDDVLAEDNLVADNARGVFIEGSHRVTLRRNVIAGSDVAVVLYDPSGGHRFEGNSFVGNMSPLDLVARQTDTLFVGNYWSGNAEPDLDGDGRSERPYRLTSVFDHFRGNLTAADILHSEWRALLAGPDPRRLTDAQRADEATAPAQDGERLRRPPRGARLAVGAGAGDHAQAPAGRAIVGVGHGAGRRLQPRQRGDAGIFEAEGGGAFVFHQAGRGAGRQRGGHETPAVGGRAGPGHETVARLHGAAVAAQRGGDARAQPLRGVLGRVQPGDGHLRSSPVRPPPAWH